ncbi:T9SS type A sorting domain-containing protein [Flavobacterium paronense]|uniref:ELWxxDGT repeat protein n=1 Tax=Flavobacterium paronense TaxID=1392775 RepID=A0ABV5GHG9_9FLAO|nr:ELWxxDGT repeat protein [Flavobacterium paronense]MDN3676440.1 T9SS type A sorting domain-containing protein [Flavobacterium paronense]
MKKLLLITAIFAAFGANAQVRLVKNHNGNASSNATPRFVYNNKLIYTALNPGSTIFHSNGTTNGSSYIFDSNNLPANPLTPTSTLAFVELNGEAHFVASFYSPSTGSYSRITKAGFADTVCSAYGNIATFTGSTFSDMNYPVVLNNEILFAPSFVLGTNAVGIELYKSDGAAVSLIKNINPGGTLSSNPAELTVLGTNCFFSAADGTNGRELWKTDGTLAGTTLYLDLNTGSADSNPAELNVLGAALTFVGTHPTLGRELFKTNGVGSLTLLKDINTSGDSNPANVTAIGSLLYFSASNGTIGQELWTSAGTTTSTVLIKDINPSGDSNPSKFKQVGSTVYFIANDGTNGVELWKTDGTNIGTVLVKNINPSGDSSPNYLTEYNGKLYFTADNGTNGVELWVSDGTSVGTTMIEINPTASSTISNLMVFNNFTNELYFSADAGVGIGKELYAYMDPTLSTGNFTLNENAITFSPNPAKDYFNLTTELNIEKVEVYSILGQLVKTFDKQDQYKISELTKGTYIVKVNTVEGALSKTLLVE